MLDFNFLGIQINEQLNWKSHIDKLSVMCCRILGILNRLKRILTIEHKDLLQLTYVALPHYGASNVKEF